MSDKPAEKPLTPKQLGLIDLMFGCAFLFVGLALPTIREQPPTYWPHAALAIAGSVLTGIGLVFAVYGGTARRKFGHPRRIPTWPIWFVVPCATLGMLVFAWLRTRFGA